MNLPRVDLLLLQKRVWISEKFSYIFEVSSSKNQACYIQSFYAYCSGYMVSTHSLLRRLGGVYYLYETPIQASFQDFSISVESWRILGITSLRQRPKDVKLVPVLVKHMLDRNMFLFGFVDINESSAAGRWWTGRNTKCKYPNGYLQIARLSTSPTWIWGRSLRWICSSKSRQHMHGPNI